MFGVYSKPKNSWSLAYGLLRVAKKSLPFLARTLGLHRQGLFLSALFVLARAEALRATPMEALEQGAGGWAGKTLSPSLLAAAILWRLARAAGGRLHRAFRRLLAGIVISSTPRLLLA